MTELDLMRVRMLIAEAGRSGALKMRDFMSDYADILTEMVEDYRQYLPEDYELPQHVIDKITALHEKVDP